MGGLYDAATLHAPLMDMMTIRNRGKMGSTLLLKRVKPYAKRTSHWQLYLHMQNPYTSARIAQSAERKALNLVVVGWSPTVVFLNICEQLLCARFGGSYRADKPN